MKLVRGQGLTKMITDNEINNDNEIKFDDEINTDNQKKIIVSQVDIDQGIITGMISRYCLLSFTESTP